MQVPPFPRYCLAVYDAEANDWSCNAEESGLVRVFSIDESSSSPIWLQLRNRIIYLITSGYYKAGDKLPTVRELAISLKINYNTVNKVYQSLLHDGYIMARRGSGTYVCDISKPDAPKEDSPADNIIDLMIAQCLGLGVPLDDIVNQTAKRVARQQGQLAEKMEGANHDQE